MNTELISNPNNGENISTNNEDAALLAKVIESVHRAGSKLLGFYSPNSRPKDRSEILEAVRRNEEVSLEILRPALSQARPQAQWVENNQETVVLPPGEWWAVDAVEGNVNHVHGLPEWCVSVTLIKDNTPVLAVVYQPIGDLTYTAIRGGGAYLNGQRLMASTKSDFSAAIVTTGQAEAGQELTYQRIGNSITAMLDRALLVRATVPTTFPLLLIANGQFEVFWQFEPVLSGVAAGALLVGEAGGIVSDVHGQPWQPGSPHFLAAAPHLHATASKVLSTVA